MSSVVQTASFQVEQALPMEGVARGGQRAKRLFDVSLGCLMLLMLLPVLAIIAVLVGLDGGPVLFRHKRLGEGGRSFGCLKFRSMRQDGEAALAAHFKLHPEAELEWLRTHKLRQDPRVTAVGRVLRDTSLDELPQLFNVIRGEMSLVGPRPITAVEAARYGGMMRFYCAGKPGITGLWQVSGRSATSYERRVELDVAYVTNWAFSKDIAILAKTVPAVLFRHGAC